MLFGSVIFIGETALIYSINNHINHRRYWHRIKSWQCDQHYLEGTMQSNNMAGSGRLGVETTNNSSSMASMGTTPPATASSSSAMAVNSQARMSQLLDDQDHKRCFEGNHRALLAENLDQLRGLVKILEADDWKYSSSSSKNQFPLDSGLSTSVPRW